MHCRHANPHVSIEYAYMALSQSCLGAFGYRRVRNHLSEEDSPALLNLCMTYAALDRREPVIALDT